MFLHHLYQIFVDSAQSGEVPSEAVLEGFTIIAHEPYYLDYTRMNLTNAMADTGFEVKSSAVYWVSKTIVAEKPFTVILG